MDQVIELFSDEELIEMLREGASSRGFNLAVITNREHVYGACLTGPLQEFVILYFLFVLYKKGILLSSIKYGDHRTLWVIAKLADLMKKKGLSACPLDHVKEIFRNAFSRATGGNKGRDGNIHWGGCKECRIIGMLTSDMGRPVGIVTAFAEAIRRCEWDAIDSGKRPIGMFCIGEGAMQQGIVSECFNWIATSNCRWPEEEFSKLNQKYFDAISKKDRIIRGAPVVAMINRNQRSLFANRWEEYGNSDLKKRALGYDMNGYDISDRNPVEMIDICWKAANDAQHLKSSLLVVDSFRGSGHNEDQRLFERGAKRTDFLKTVKVFGYDSVTEYLEAWENDPLLKLRDYIVDMDIINQKEADELIEHEIETMAETAREILKEPEITVEEDKKDRTIFPPIDWEKASLLFPSSKIHTETKTLGYYEAYQYIIREGLKKGDIYFGQDVAKEGGVLGFTKGLAEEFGFSKIWNTPIIEEMMAAAAAGYALYGMYPCCEFQFAPFYREAYALLATVAPMWYQKKMKFPFLLMFPCGVVRRGGSGEYHEGWPERELDALETVAIVCPSNAYELVGLVRFAREFFKGPVMLLLQISAANSPIFASKVPLEPYVIPFGQANIVKEGKDVTIVTYDAACVHAAKYEAEAMKKEDGIDIEVIDVRTINPLDVDTIRKSFKKTGRIIAFHEASKKKGVGREILFDSVCDENDIAALDYCLPKNMKVVCAGMEGDIYVPSAGHLVWARLPYYMTRIDGVDEEGRSIKLDIPRSRTLNRYIKDLMRYT